MALTFKIIGFMLTISAGVMFGFFKVSALKERRDALREVCKGLRELHGELTVGLKELPRLIDECFSRCSYIEISGMSATAKGKQFSEEDKRIINEFFHDAGKLNSQREGERTKVYVNLLEKQLSESEERLLSEGKLWKTLSICMSIGGGILFL